jgi:hypothetical protein
MRAVRSVIGGLATLGLGIAGGYLASKAWVESTQVSGL